MTVTVMFLLALLTTSLASDDDDDDLDIVTEAPSEFPNIYEYPTVILFYESKFKDLCR